MKSDTLKSLLNKVVEYNNPSAYGGNGCNFKAFLYKNSNGYYFKIVEIVSGTDLAFNDIIYLKDGDEQYLMIAEKPKLMRISKNSWHYRLMKYILRSNAPTPKDMQNGCPYFWLLIFSLLVVSFVVLFKGIGKIILFFPDLFFKLLEAMTDNWLNNLDDEVAFDINRNGRYGSRTKLPTTAKLYFDRTYDSVFDTYLLKKYNLKSDDPEYDNKKTEIHNKWKAWLAELDKKREEKWKLTEKKEAEIREKRRILDAKREESRKRWDARMKPIENGLDKMDAWFKKTFTVERGRRNMIIKRTKQFVGAIITLIVLGLTFIAINYISLGLMVAIDWCIAYWKFFVIIGALGAIGGIAYVLYVLISSWGQNMVNRYKQGKKIWYVEPFIYLVWYPIKYIAIAIAFIIVKIIWSILKFLFYTVIFKYFLKPIGRTCVKLAKGIAGSSGIFGEYFGASYSDYCPGIEWVDFDEE